MQKGIESLKASVKKDAYEGENCFNENGCDHEFTRMVPQDNPKLLQMGIKQSCIRVCKCSHKYCDKYKWVIDRAKHYSERTGKPIQEIIKVWEENRTYWYMNYYGEGNQPLDGIKINDQRIVNLNERILFLENQVNTYESMIPLLTEKHQELVKSDFEQKLNSYKKELEICKSRLALFELSLLSTQ